MILENLTGNVNRYNLLGLHYNLVSEAIYKARAEIDPFSKEYECYLIAGLLVFDMGRLMGSGDKYTDDESGFRSRLRAKLKAIRPEIQSISNAALNEIDITACADGIETAYDCLADGGEGALSAIRNRRFHVGATKILHWIAPSLFIMLDLNVAMAYKQCHDVAYRDTTQPGYTAKKYVECLRLAQTEIRTYGYEKFRQTEPETPPARLFDKAAWVVGQQNLR